MAQEKRIKLTASGKLAPGAFVNLSAAGCGCFGKVKDPATGKSVDGVVYVGRLDPGQSVEVDVIEFQERLQAAVDRGELTIQTAAK